LAVQTCQRPFPPTSAMLSRTGWGPKNKQKILYHLTQPSSTAREKKFATHEFLTLFSTG
jgi:hypothetical protein